MSNTVELKRANKITAFWDGDGVACGIFYRTHDKIVTVRSNDEAVVAAGFKFPEGTDEAPITAAQKLDAFKTFLAMNSSTFGIAYDPVDRRADEYKYPSKYDDASLKEYSGKTVNSVIVGILESVQSSVIDKMIKAEHLPSGSKVAYGVGEPAIEVTDKYPSGNLKYATVKYPVVIAVGEKRAETSITVELVSGQLKKPRNIGDTVLTMTGIKNMLVEQGVLPKIETKSAKTAEGEATEEAASETVGYAPSAQ